MELNEDEIQNKRKFKLLKDLNIYGVIIISIMLAIEGMLILIDHYEYESKAWLLGAIVGTVVIRLLFGYICADYLRPQVHGNRTFAFTMGASLGYLGILIYYIYIKIVENGKGTLESAII